MAVRLQLSCGLRGSCKSARQGLDFPASEPDAIGTPRPCLPPDIVRLIDAIMRAAERAERAEMLRAMSGDDLGLTLRDAADVGGLLDARCLLAAGADAGSVNGWALYNACLGDHIQVADVLLDSVGTLTREHRNIALIRAAYRGHTACCALMLDCGADINSRPYGADALWYAAWHGHPGTVAVLLDRGADALSEEAMEYAVDCHHHAVVALLLARRRGRARGAAH